MAMNEKKKSATTGTGENDTNKGKDDCERCCIQRRLSTLEDRLTTELHELRVNMTRLLETKAESKVIIRRPIGLKRLEKKIIMISKKRAQGTTTIAATKNYST